MKTLKCITWTILLAVCMISCDEYDDSELWDKVNSLDNRVTSIEEQLEQLNKDISTIDYMLRALDRRLYVANVVAQKDGYELTFSDGSQITIANKESVPIINIQYHAGDKKYYWTKTIDGVTTWLYDDEGNKLPVSGNDGVTPLLKVDSQGYWVISYDLGKTYSRIPSDNDPEGVKAKGEDGDSFFEEVKITGDELWITLKDGTEIVLPLGEQSPYKAVDLGLSVRWASFNLGATSPSELGGLYFWGDPTNEGEFLFEAPNIGNICGTEYDIVRNMWGGTWRLPNRDEQQELVNTCIWTRTIVNRVEGMKISGKNGNSIFLPATGIGFPKSGPLPTQTERIWTDRGYYWTGESYKEAEEQFGYVFNFDTETTHYDSSWNVATVKIAIRPVKE